MENLNAEQIIKALECCAVWGDCKNCPYDKDEYKSKENNCTYNSTKDALSLIKELTEENERLSKEVADLQDELKCEKETNEHLCGEYMSAKADTVREFLENATDRAVFKDNTERLYVTIENLKQIAKKLTEGG